MQNHAFKKTPITKTRFTDVSENTFITLLTQVRQVFDRHPDHRTKGVTYSLSNTLMSAVAMFSLKDETLYAFDDHRKDPLRQQNLRQLYASRPMTRG